MGAKTLIRGTKDSTFSLRCRLWLLTWGLSLKQQRRPIHDLNSRAVHILYVCLLCFFFLLFFLIKKNQQ